MMALWFILDWISTFIDFKRIDDFNIEGNCDETFIVCIVYVYTL